MFDWLKQFVPLRKPASPSEATAQALSQALGGKCPRCRSDLRDHAFQMFAMTVATAERREALADLISKARKHDWESLSKFHDFNPLENALEVHALRCADRRLNMLLVRNPSELYDVHSVEDLEVLGENESSVWSGYLSNEKWISFVSSGKETA